MSKKCKDIIMTVIFVLGLAALLLFVYLKIISWVAFSVLLIVLAIVLVIVLFDVNKIRTDECIS